MYEDSECVQVGSFVKLQLVKLHAITAHSRKEHIAATAMMLTEPRITRCHGNLADFFPSFASTSSTAFDLVTSDLLVTLRSVSTDEVLDWSDLTAAMRTDCRTGVSVSVFTVVFRCVRTTTVSLVALDALPDGDSTFAPSDLRVVLDGDACSDGVLLF